MNPRLAAAACLALSQCDLAVAADLRAPRVLAAEPSEGALGVLVGGPLRVTFDEPMDPTAVDEGNIHLAPADLAQSCRLAPRCSADAPCLHGSCQAPTVTASDRSRARAGEVTGGVCVEATWHPGPAGPDSELWVTPCTTLPGHRLHELVIGGLRDRSGAPLAGGAEPGELLISFVTGGEESSGPVPHLLSPPPQALGVPTNRSSVRVGFQGEVWPRPDAWLGLEDEEGHRRRLVDPIACPDVLAGHCYEFSLDGPLDAEQAYQLRGGAVVDALGRPARTAFEPETFWTGHAADETPPDPDAVTQALHGPCVHVRYRGEAAAVTLEVADERRHGAGEDVELAVAVSSEAALEVTLTDLAGNVTRVTSIARPPEEPPDLVITEVLHNPLGPEPDQEFVELLALRDTTLAGVFLSDSDPEGTQLPAESLAAGEVVVLVPPGFVSGAGGDAPLAAGARLIALPGPVGGGGLANAGERVAVHRGDPSEVISSYGDHLDPGAAATAGHSVMRRSAGACDVASAWVWSNGLATPGSLP